MARHEVKGIVWAASRTYLVEPAERIVELRGLDEQGESWRRSVLQAWQEITAGEIYFVTRADTGEPVLLEAAPARPRYVRTLPDENGRDHLVALGEPRGQLARMLGDVLSAHGLASLCRDLDLDSEGSKQAKAERIAELVQTFEGLVRRLDDSLLRKMATAYDPDFAGTRIELIDFLSRHTTGELVSPVRRPGGAESEAASEAPRRAAAPEPEPRAAPPPPPPPPRQAISSAAYQERLAALLLPLRALVPARQPFALPPEAPLAGLWELSGGAVRASLPVFESDRDAARLLAGELCEWLGGPRTQAIAAVPERFDAVSAPALSRFLAAFSELRAPPLFHATERLSTARLAELLELAALEE